MLSNNLRNFVASELRIEPDAIAPESRLQHELGLDGKDADTFMTHFAREFDIDMTNYRFADYFGREMAGCIPLWIVWLFIPPLRPKVTAISLADLQRAIDKGRWPKKNTLARRK